MISRTHSSAFQARLPGRFICRDCATCYIGSRIFAEVCVLQRDRRSRAREGTGGKRHSAGFRFFLKVSKYFCNALNDAKAARAPYVDVISDLTHGHGRASYSLTPSTFERVCHHNSPSVKAALALRWIVHVTVLGRSSTQSGRDF